MTPSRAEPRGVDRFVVDGRDRWAELAGLVDRAGGRLDRLPPDEAMALGDAYRATAADLARARQRWPGDPVVAELEALVARARTLVYRRAGGRGSFGHWLTTGFFRRVRERPGVLLVSALLLWGTALVTGLWAHADPEAGTRAAGISGLSEGAVEAARSGTAGDGSASLGPAERASFSSQILTNNIRVALTAFAGGVTGGLLTAAALVFNGVVIGVVVGVFVALGLGGEAVSLVAPHGLLELSLITVAGAAGLRVGLALVAPGLRPRGEALVAEARAAAEMALGVALWLVPTGLVEGFVSPERLAPGAALAVGLAVAGPFWALVAWRGRPRHA